MKNQLSYYCVDCGSKLDNDLQCKLCERKYDKVSGIPVLLSKEDMDSELFKRYWRNYDEIAHDDLIKPITHIDIQKKLRDITLHFMGGVSPKAKVIDVGCGRGNILSRLNCEVKVGCDIALEYLISLGSQITPVLCNVEKLPFKNEFDLAICTSVLEHVFNPYSTLENIHSALKKEGKLYVRVPIEKDLSVYAHNKYEFVHLHTFNKNSLIKILEETNFRVKRIKGVFINANLGAILFNKPTAILVEAHKYAKEEGLVKNED